MSVIAPSAILNQITAADLNVNISPELLDRGHGSMNGNNGTQEGKQMHVMERRRSRNFAGGDAEDARRRF